MTENMEDWAIWYLTLGAIADLVTTWAALNDGAVEMNPIAKMFGESHRSIMYTASASKIIGIIIIGMVLYVPWSTACAIVIGSFWLFGGAVNNLVRMLFKL